MRIEELKAELQRRNALIVHCSRPGRDGEIDKPPKPLYPDDLTCTIQDLKRGGGRGVSCSVIWPDHQQTFGAVGIILDPQCMNEIVSMHTSDAGYQDCIGGFGEPPSIDAVGKTFAASDGYNEWVITGANVRGIFINQSMPIEVARVAPIPDEIPDEQRYLFGESAVVACPITLQQVAADFDDLTLFTYEDGTLITIST